MQLMRYMQTFGHEEVVFRYDKTTGLKAIIAVHDTTLGPALGGVRMWPYRSEAEALLDVLRLSEGMTYKAAVAGLNLGGGEAVLMGDPATDKSPALFRSFGQFVASFNGRYITAEDVGTGVNDMTHIRRETRFVAGLSAAKGGGGDPAIVTALGVYRGIKACCEAMFGSNSLRGRVVAIQGVGKVGTELAKHLAGEGAELLVADTNPQAIERIRRILAVETVDPDQIYEVKCDVFAPCALGAVINDRTLPRLRCAIVAGAANNQLAEMEHGAELHRRDILYAPDYVINAGGLLSVAAELGAYDASEAWSRAAAIYDTMNRLIDLAERQNIPTHTAARRLALERIRQSKQKPDRSPTRPSSTSDRLPLAA